MSVLNLLAGIVVLSLIVLFTKQTFIFVAASLPFFLVRVMLEIFQVQLTLTAIEKASRSTFSFLRLLTIPLLLLVDISLGYDISTAAMIGMAVMFFGVSFVLFDKNFEKAGSKLIIFTAMNAVLTISLYKYNIEHFNSVAGEQIPMAAILLVYFFILSRIKNHEHPIALLKQRIFQKQTLASGIGSAFDAFAYSFAPASVITTARRGFAVFWSILSGQHYFHERHILLKLLTLGFFVVGLVLLAVN